MALEPAHPYKTETVSMSSASRSAGDAPAASNPTERLRTTQPWSRRPPATRVSPKHPGRQCAGSGVLLARRSFAFSQCRALPHTSARPRPHQKASRACQLTPNASQQWVRRRPYMADPPVMTIAAMRLKLVKARRPSGRKLRIFEPPPCDPIMLSRRQKAMFCSGL